MTNFAYRIIWTGDNLDILRGLNSASVDLIYLDRCSTPTATTPRRRRPGNIENLQLLCAHCNRVKGDRPQEYLVAKLPELGIAA